VVMQLLGVLQRQSRQHLGIEVIVLACLG
jgi:hypothetical protein